MEIDLDWIQKELNTGRKIELECVDVIGFLEGVEVNEKILDQGLLVVEYIYSDGDIRLVGHIDDLYFNTIASEEFKYFRIKQAPTFDDLIDVAVKAVKNRVLFTMSIGDNKRKGRYLNYAVSGNSSTESFYESDDDYQSCIDFIKSLYTETFVIESEEDYNSLKSDANIRLLNGEVIKRIVNYSACTPEFSDADGRIVRLSYLTLKGATVTQQKGNK